MKVFQKGFNYSQDGPGNRLVIHLQGCNLSCPWCSNPEGMALSGSLLVNPAHLFDSVCPKGAVKNHEINREICDNCEEKACLLKKSQAINWSCVDYSIDEMENEIVSCRYMYFDKGGVTFSGGEPTLQLDELLTLLKRLKDKNINTAIETNGTHIQFEKLIPYLDHIMIDFKHPDCQQSKEITGCSNVITKSNIRKALEAEKDVVIRIPLIGGFNTTETAIEGFVQFFKEINVWRFKVECLPYHEYGKEKWLKCGKKYSVTEGAISQLRLIEIENRLRKEGIELIKT